MPRQQDLDDDDEGTDASALLWRARLLALVDLALESRLRFELADPVLAADRLELLSSRAGQLAGRLRAEMPPATRRARPSTSHSPPTWSTA